MRWQATFLFGPCRDLRRPYFLVVHNTPLRTRIERRRRIPYAINNSRFSVKIPSRRPFAEIQFSQPQHARQYASTTEPIRDALFSVVPFAQLVGRPKRYTSLSLFQGLDEGRKDMDDRGNAGTKIRGGGISCQKCHTTRSHTRDRVAGI